VFKQGTYAGDGGTQSITGLGFDPKLVLVKADHATNANAMLISDTMTLARNVTNDTEDAGIALITDGFTVTHVASAVGRTNESGKTYYWAAWGGDDVVTGQYTGTGAANSVVTAMTPLMVWIKAAAPSATYFRTNDMSTESFDFSTSLGATDEITSLDASGFTLGVSTNVNALGTVFDYIAFSAADNFAVGTYSGDGADDRELPASAMDFDPLFVAIKADAGQLGVWKPYALAGDLSLNFGTVASVANKIQSLTPASGQFQVGTHAEVNNGSLTYFFFAFSEGGTGGGPPLDADYLVGTANPTLTNEIVVGTTPGGELGGTWASPTVDATHSGSAHHAQTHAADHAKAGADDLAAQTIEVTMLEATTIQPDSDDLGNDLTIRANAGIGSFIKIQSHDGTSYYNLLNTQGGNGSFGGKNYNAFGTNVVWSKSTLTIDANDEVTVPTTSWVYLTPNAGASDSLDGIGAGNLEGQIAILTPTAGNDITLVHDGTVTAGQKLMISGEADAVLDQDHDFAIAVYDATALVWKVFVPFSAQFSAPAGELGGTWASPTVDATHSGSAHHDAVTIGADAEHSLAAQVLSGVAASATQVGHVELATIAETDTGTDGTRAVTPDGLAGSNYGERTIGILVSDPNGDAITVGDSKAYATIPSTLNGWNLVEVAAQLSTVSSSGIPTVQLHRSRRASATTRTLADMLSTKLTIDASEFESSDAAAAAVIDTANDDVNTGDQVHVDIDVAGTGAKGLFVLMTFRLP